MGEHEASHASPAGLGRDLESPRVPADAAREVDARFAADLARYADEVELIVLPAANSRRVQPTDFDQASHLTAEALAACRELLAGPALAPAA